MASSKGLWLVGTNEGKAEGAETKGTWGLQHLVGENGYTKVKLNNASAKPETLIPGTCTWSMTRANEGENKVQAKNLHFGPVHGVLDPLFVPFAGIIDNCLGAEDVTNRVNFVFFGIRDVSERGTNKQHHWFTLTGTNGWIRSVNYSFGRQDAFSLTLSATVWRWEQWDSAGGKVGEVAAAHFDEKGATVSGHAKA